MRKTVSQRDSNGRLDAFIAKSLKGVSGETPLSRVRVREYVERGLVMVNGAVGADPARKLRQGDVVETDFPAFSGDGVLSPNPDVPVRVLFEDDRILVLDKPAGVQMHPAGRDGRDTIANFALAHVPKIAGVGDDPVRPGIVHRLDRNTSGVVVLAKTDESFLALKDLFKRRSVRKVYRALVLGHVKTDEGEIAMPLATRAGTLRRIAVTDPEKHPPESGMKQALTLYRVIGRYDDYDLLEAEPKTGRTHQIRVHFAAIGHPVVGDRLYGGRRMKTERMPERQLLHAARIEFELFGKKYAFESPIPDDFSDFIRE